jgi:tRNA (uracil-5-)-methyltransferase
MIAGEEAVNDGDVIAASVSLVTPSTEAGSEAATLTAADSIEDERGGGDGRASEPTPPTDDRRSIDNHRQPGAFDHANRRVIVHNVLRYLKEKQIDALVSSWLAGHEDGNIIVAKAKKPPRDNWLKVTLAHESMVRPFIAIINTGGVGGTAQLNSRGQPVRAERDNHGGNDDRDDDDGWRQNGGTKRKELHDNDNDGRNDNEERNSNINNNHTNNNENNNKRYKSSSQESTISSTPRILSSNEVRDAITPYWTLPYQKQLDTKMKELINKCAKTIIKDVKSKFKLMEREYSRDKKRKRGGNCSGKLVLYDWANQLRAIDIDEILPSPLRYEYRNKCEFTFGYRLVPSTETTMEEMANDTKAVTVVVDDINRKKQSEENNGVDNTTLGEMCDNVDTTTPTAVVESTTAFLSSSSTLSSSSVPITAKFRKVPAAGFLPQGWNGGIYLPHALQNMPNWSCGIADIFNNNFLPSSPLPPYDSKVHCGIWRTVTIRCSLRTKECMIIVVHASPKAVGARKEEEGVDANYLAVFESEKARLVKLLTSDPIPTPIRDFPDSHNSNDMILPEQVETKKLDFYDSDKEGDLRVTSIYFQEFDGVSMPGPDHPVQHVYGKKYLEESLGKCTFQISPGAFFQTNTEGAEVLYNIIVDRIREVTTDPQRTLLLDVCCGTGTIGLTCLKEGVVGKLIGIDIAEPAIADAKINAEKNGYHDESNNEGVTRFVASAAEKIMPEIMKEITTSIREGTTTTPLVVAVVDPARNGLHAIVVRTLRANERIQRLIYVSCNPVGTLTRDAAMLCGPPTKKYPGRPFKPTRSQPMDMFPMTKHCEMVMTLDRMSKEEYEKYQT